MSSRLYTARHLLPVTSPPIVDGAVVVENGRVSAFGRRKELLDRGRATDLGDAVLLPGPVNAHTHLELSSFGDDPLPRGDYLAWLEALVARRDREDEARSKIAAETQLAGWVEEGVSAVGDIANRDWSARLLAESPLRAVVFHELIGFHRQAADEVFANGRATAERMQAALTPHGPHTVSTALMTRIVGHARERGAPLSIHVAESPMEVRMLDGGDPGYIRFLEGRKTWDPEWTPPGTSPVRALDALGALGERTLVVHAVHLDDDDRRIVEQRGCTVVTCPRSNEWLGVGTAGIGKLLDLGIPVALGTDSLASVPDLSIWAELAALRTTHPGLSPQTALRIATVNGAQALGLDIIPSWAVVPLASPGDDPLETVTTGAAGARRLS